MTKADNAAQLLALSALAGVILAPPEAFGSGRMILVVASTFSFLILVLEGQVTSRYLMAGLAGVAVLGAHSLWISIDFYRSLEFLGIVWAYYCLFGYLAYSRVNSLHRVAATMVMMAGVVSIYGIYQFFWGIDAMYGLVFYSDAPEPVRVPMLEQLATERIFSTFALPGTLWGYLLLALPLHGILWKPGRRFFNSLLVVNTLLLLATGALTRSYGFVLGLLVLVLGWLFTRPGSRPWRAAAAVTLLMTLLAGGIYFARSETHNPVTLRLQNWMTGWEIFAANPLGVGLNGYAVAYLGHQQPGANETQFAHNTPIQLLSELGLVAFIAMAALVLYLIGRRRLIFDTTGSRRYLLLGLLVWSVHNLIEINIYFASVGATGVALIGLLVAQSRPADQRMLRNPVPDKLAQITGLAAMAFIFSSGIIYVSGELLHRARVEIENQKLMEASETLDNAMRINPFNSSILHEAGQLTLELHQKTQAPVLLTRATEYFSRAVDLSPNKVGPHLGLGLCLSSADELDEALEQMEIAQSMHPYSRHVSSVRRLIENRQAARSGQ